MGDLLNRAETGSLGSGSSSSGISSNSGSQCARPGPINNSNLLAPNPYNVFFLLLYLKHFKYTSCWIQLIIIIGTNFDW